MNSFDVKNMLSQDDLNVLYEIYMLRCLTITQIYNNFYKKDYVGVQEFRDKKLNMLLNTGAIEEVEFSNDNSAIFLTRLGIDVVVSEFKIPINIVDKNGVKRGFYRSSELKLQPKNIPHQVHLNQFMLDFKTVYSYKQLDMPWTYFDEKYVSQYTKIRPDGLIRILDVDLFLEMDMSTESKVQLEAKWRNYKVFLNSAEHRHNEQKVIVLFIIENTDLIENRKNLVKLTASNIVLDDIDDNFEIIVGTKEELLMTVFNSIIPDIKKTNYKKANVVNLLTSKFGLNVSDASILSKRLGNQDYGFFVRRLDKSNNILIDHNKIQGFLIDYCYNNTLSTIAKIVYLDRNLSDFHYYYKWTPSYIIISENLEQLHKDLQFLKLDQVQNVYFTTLDDLEKNKLPYALYQFHNDGEKYSFEDMGLKKRHYLK